MSTQALLASLAKATAGILPGVDIRYRLFEDTTFNATTAVQVTTYHDVSILKVPKATASVQDVGSGAGSVQMGDAKFEFPASDLASHLRYAASGDISTSDVIEQGATTYRVAFYTKFGNDTMYRIFARKQT